METPDLFKAIDVWQRKGDGGLVRYRCFQSLRSGKYSVQSQDHYRVPVDEKVSAYLDRQYLELLREQSPSERSTGHDSLVDAISDFVSTFSDDLPEGNSTNDV